MVNLVYVHRYDPGHSGVPGRVGRGHAAESGHDGPVPPGQGAPGRRVHSGHAGDHGLPDFGPEGVPHVLPGGKRPGHVPGHGGPWHGRPFLLYKSSHDYRKAQLAISSDQRVSKVIT